MKDKVRNLLGIPSQREVALELQRLVPLAQPVLIINRLRRYLVTTHRNSKPPIARRMPTGEGERLFKRVGKSSSSTEAFHSGVSTFY